MQYLIYLYFWQSSFLFINDGGNDLRQSIRKNHCDTLELEVFHCNWFIVIHNCFMMSSKFGKKKEHWIYLFSRMISSKKSKLFWTTSGMGVVDSLNSGYKNIADL